MKPRIWFYRKPDGFWVANCKLGFCGGVASSRTLKIAAELSYVAHLQSKTLANRKVAS